MSLRTGQAELGQSVAGTSRAGVSLFPRVPRQGYQHDQGVPHERVPQDSGRTVTNAQNTTQASINLRPDRSGSSLIRPDRPQDHAPHPADQGLHFERILGFCPSRRPGWAYRREAPRKEGASPNSKPELCFHAIGNKIAGNAQQNARRERLFIRESALSAIFCCGFAAGMC